MCLAVLPTYQVEILSKPLVVYKICTLGLQNNELYSSIQQHKYPAGLLQVCQAPFKLATEYRYCRFVDSKDNFKTKVLFGEHLKNAWASGKFHMIATGFHFYFNIERALDSINQRYNPSEDIIVPFQIPAGARIIRGIDNDLGVTDQIMRL